MTHSHTGLALYRDALRDAIDADLARRRRRPRARLLALPATATTGAVAATAAILLTAGSAVAPTVDAAIARDVSAALNAPAGSIVHQKAMVSIGNQAAQQFELWESTSPPFAYRVIKWGHEGTGTATHGAPNNPAAILEAMVASGQVQAIPTTFDGVAAYKLNVAGASDPWVNGTAYVARSNYYPLMIESNGETIRYQTFEYLPPSAANQRLLTP